MQDAQQLPFATTHLGTPVSFDLISFDLDGTLVDTASEIAAATNLALQCHGIGARPVAEITLLIGAGLHALMLKLLARCVAEQPSLQARLDIPAMLRSLDEHYAQTVGRLALPYPGCLDALTRLRTAGLKLACVTNKELRHTHQVLQASGLASCFDAVIGGDSLPQKKPHASVLQHTAQSLGVSVARTVHVGDSSTDVAAARNAGVAAWAVSYGYNAGRPIQECQPDRVFDSLAEVADHALEQRAQQRCAAR